MCNTVYMKYVLSAHHCHLQEKKKKKRKLSSQITENLFGEVNQKELLFQYFLFFFYFFQQWARSCVKVFLLKQNLKKKKSQISNNY